MRFIIITGMSGAGKSRALATFEDMGFYCVDNMPQSLIPKFAELALSGDRYENVALVTDVRAGDMSDDLFDSLDAIFHDEKDYKVLFLDASSDVLVNRYKETRRRHPLTDSGADILGAIESEREMLDRIRARADYIIDTTPLSAAGLRETLLNLFMENADKCPIVVNVLSFGFKYGIPTESDIVFDVRFLPNPYYDPELREKTGLSDDVKDYIFASGEADVLMKKLCDLFDFIMPGYVTEGKNSLVISVGCTGGQHRSVAIAEKICEYFKSKSFMCTVNHRDMMRRRNSAVSASGS